MGSRGAPSRQGWTIDELARLAGTSSRNVRAYQTAGLLPHPRLIGRTGWYDEDHLALLTTVLRLAERGYSLSSIAELLDAWSRGASLEDVLGLPRAHPGRRRGRPGADPVAALFDSMERWPVRTRASHLALLPEPLLDAVRRPAG
ncbi:MAG: MerR family transcriptional regulator [Acidimicrobiales bacterium]